jgi:hypothetical protein
MPIRIIRITRDIDAERPGEYAIHAGVGGQDDPFCLEPLTQFRLQVSGDGDDDRGGLLLCHVVDQLELLFWSQRGLQDDHLVTVPGVVSGLRRGQSLDLDSEAAGGRTEALREQEFVLHEKQLPSHRLQNSARSRGRVF